MKRLLQWIVVALVGAAAIEYLTTLAITGDTVNLLHEVDSMIAALRTGHIGWGGMFPPLQQIPATALRLSQFDEASAVRWLVGCNLAAFAGLVARGYRSLRGQSSRVAALFVFVLFSSPLLWYAHSSFGEMLAAFFTLSFAADCREEAPRGRIFADGLLAGISKETAFPFVLLLGVATTFADPARRTDRSFVIGRGRLLVLLAAATATINGAFNYLRYRSAFNPVLMDPLLQVHTARDQVSFFFGLWSSPNGGILFFWPSFCLLFVLAAIAARRSFRAAAGREGRLAAAIPILGASLSLLGLTLGFSRWVFPMGWYSWGPRFLMPWIPSIAWLLCRAYHRPLDDLLGRLNRPAWRATAIGAALTVVSVPHFAVLFRPSMLIGFFAPDADFPKIGVLQEDPQYYLRFIHHLLWTKPSILLAAYTADPTPASLLTLGCSFALLLFWSKGPGQKPG
jgi:hypothetical protein